MARWIAPWPRKRVALTLAAGLALRLLWMQSRPAPLGDPLIYGAIARNWLLHGVYGYATVAGHALPTLIRLPGYPLFLLACFRLFGVEHWRAVLLLQVAVDLGTALLVGATARRLWSNRAGAWALALAATCPFLANYAAVPLTETLELFTIALSFYLYARLAGPRGLLMLNAQGVAEVHPPAAHLWERRQSSPILSAAEDSRLIPRGATLLLAFAWSYAALLRPDGALLAVTLFLALVLSTQGRGWRVALVAGLLSVLPFVPWTVRNWHTFHVFEPLAPRYATDPGEPIHPGFQAWARTVCADFACTQEIYWNLDSDALDLGSLPARAFDSPAQYAQTKALFDAYNQTNTLTPEGDAGFARLAAERRHAHPFRSVVGMPLLRLADMFLRPRLELTGNDLRWWQWSEHHGETVFGYTYAALNLAYLLLALRGAWRRPPLLGAMVAFVVLRSALLLTIEAPEQRYTLEFFPLEFVLAGVALGGGARERATADPSLRSG